MKNLLLPKAVPGCPGPPGQPVAASSAAAGGSVSRVWVVGTDWKLDVGMNCGAMPGCL